MGWLTITGPTARRETAQSAHRAVKIKFVGSSHDAKSGLDWPSTNIQHETNASFRAQATALFPNWLCQVVEAGGENTSTTHRGGKTI